MWTNNTLEQLISGVLQHGPDVLKFSLTTDDISQYRERVFNEHLDYPLPKEKIDKDNWFIPNEYKTMDIEKYLLDVCPEENYGRLQDELALFRKYNMIPVLKSMKYIVDTLRKNNVVWGVGRGSSVSSYVLYLIGIHRIDSVKYDLPIEEFFKGI